MARDLSRSPPLRRRRSPSPIRHDRKYRKIRSRSPFYNSYSNTRRKSRSVSPKLQWSRSPMFRRRKSRSPTPRRFRRQRSRSSSFSSLNKSRSSSPLLTDTINISEKFRKAEEDKKRHQQEAEFRLIEAETTRRVEEGIQKLVEQSLSSQDMKLEIDTRLADGRKRVLLEVTSQLETEREADLVEARKKEEKSRREKEELEKMMEESRRKVEEAQRREMMEQQRKEEERYRELERMQREREEAMKRKKMEEEEARTKQMMVLGKNKSRPRLSFALGSK